MRRLLFAAPATVFVSACAMVAGLGEYGTSSGEEDPSTPSVRRDPSEAGGGDAPQDAGRDSAKSRLDAALRDASDAAPPDADVSAPPPRPEWCDAVTLYVPFEGSFKSDRGVQPTDSTATLAAAEGLIGGAGDLRSQGGKVTYEATSSIWSLPQGSVSIWIRPTWTLPCASDVWVWYAGLTDSAGEANATGPALHCNAAGDWLGTAISYNVSPRASLAASAATAWRNNEWNHLVATWNTSASPTLTFNLDCAAGCPYGATFASTWAPIGAIEYVRLGALHYSAFSLVDEFVMFSKQLGPKQIESLHQAGASRVAVSEICRR